MEFASIYPRAAREFGQIAGRMESYTGGEWGFRYYFAQAGVKQFSSQDKSLPGGSWLVRPRLALPYEVDKGLLALAIPVQRITYNVGTPLRLLDWRSPAGFYSTYWGKVPFSLSWSPLEELDVRQVNYLAERFAAATIESESGDQPVLGRITIRGRTLDGILLHSGTRLVYPLKGLRASTLKLKCGISPDAYVDGDDGSFEFRVNLRDMRGAILASAVAAAIPGLKETDRDWRPVQLDLGTGSMDSAYLELRYDSSGKHRNGQGIFAEPLFLDTSK
jgi:hypothetical protein